MTHAVNQGLRVDTHNGVPDITFVRLRHTDAQATAREPWPLWVMGEDLVAAGFNNQAKVYAALYDGHSTWACGGASSPALPKLGAMYLQAEGKPPRFRVVMRRDSEPAPIAPATSRSVYSTRSCT